MKIEKASSISIIFLFISCSFNPVLAKAGSIFDKEQDSLDKRYSIGSSLFLLGNLSPGDSPYYFMLNYSYRLSQNDNLFAEAISWTYYEPLGTYGSSIENYPGKIRVYGVGLGYQRFLWKNLYVTAQVTPFLQQFFDEENNKIQNGFQLYLQSRIGYRFEFFNHSWFLEPSIAFNYWPVNTHVPEAFKAIENSELNYFLFEPGLNFGFKF